MVWSRYKLVSYVSNLLPIALPSSCACNRVVLPARYVRRGVGIVDLSVVTFGYQATICTTQSEFEYLELKIEEGLLDFPRRTPWKYQ